LSKSPAKKLAISPDEIRAVYAQGEEAVIALVEGLLQRIAVLEARVEQLENQVGKNSRNRSKPPSIDGFKPQPKSLRNKNQRTNGGQKGHPGQTLEWSSEVDQVEYHQVVACQVCGTSLVETEVESWDIRQVQDLAPIRLEVTEH
jgi:transposase